HRRQNDHLITADCVLCKGLLNGDLHLLWCHQLASVDVREDAARVPVELFDVQINLLLIAQIFRSLDDGLVVPVIFAFSLIFARSCGWNRWWLRRGRRAHLRYIELHLRALLLQGESLRDAAGCVVASRLLRRLSLILLTAGTALLRAEEIEEGGHCGRGHSAARSE
ncbi:hypothetical protein PMAYCL1PPCAC_26609, partial [Pristionchus mayeri]